MTEITDQNIPYPPYASLILHGKDLNPQKITDAFEITATRSFQRGDKRKNGKAWPHGSWSLDSKGKIESLDPALHIEWIVEQIEPLQAKLLEIVEEQTLDACISCFWIMPRSNERLVLKPDLMRRIGSLHLVLDMDIYSPI